MPSGNNYNIEDVLLHGKKDNEESIILPFTRYENVLGAPSIVFDINEYKGSPFFLYVTDTLDIPKDDLVQLVGDIFPD